MRFVVFVLSGLLLAGQTGCAAYYAGKMPGPVADEQVVVGMNRAQVETLIGVGPVSQYAEGDGTAIRYEYSDGVPGGAKVRILPYVAADIFSAFLSEIIFWPIEVHATGRIKRVGQAHYDAQNKLVTWNVSRTSGETVPQDKR